MHSTTYTWDCIDIKSTWAIIFSFVAKLSKLITLNSKSTSSLSSCVHMTSTSKLAFARTPITSFSALIFPCTLAKLHSPWIDILEIDNEDCSPFTRGGKTCFAQARSIYNLLIKTTWPTNPPIDFCTLQKSPLEMLMKLLQTPLDGGAIWATYTQCVLSSPNPSLVGICRGSCPCMDPIVHCIQQW